MRFFYVLIFTFSIVSNTTFAIDLDSLRCDFSSLCSQLSSRVSWGKKCEKFGMTTEGFSTSIHSKLSSLRAFRKEQVTELDKPETARTEKDPRLGILRWWSGEDKNPITLGLKNNIELSDRQITLAENLRDLLDDIERLKAADAQQIIQKLPKQHREVLSWLESSVLSSARDANDLLVEASSLKTPDDKRGALKTMERLETDVSRDQRRFQDLATFLISKKSSETIIAEYYAATGIEIEKDIQQRVKEILGRGINANITRGLAAFSVRYQKTPAETAQIFSKLDNAGLEVRSEGIRDPFIVGLMALEAEYKKTNTVSDFVKLDKSLNDNEFKFTVDDREVLALLETSYRSGVSFEEVKSRFFEINQFGKSRPNFYFDDPSIAMLVDLSFRYKLSAKVLSKPFFEIQEKAEKRRNWYLTDPATAILVDVVLRNKINSENAEIRTFEFYKAHMDGKLGNKIDEEYARMAAFSYEFKLTASEVMSMMGSVSKITGNKASTDRKLTVLAIAIDQKGSTKITETDIKTAAALPYLTLVSSQNNLVSSASSRSSYNSDDSGMATFSVTNPMNTYNIATGGGSDGNLITPW